MVGVFPKVISFIVAGVIYAIVAFFGLGAMLLAMNGYNDTAAEAAIPAYLISQVIFTVVCGGLAVISTWIFQNKLQLNVALAVTLGILTALLFGGIMILIGMGVGIGFGDAAFKQH